MKDFTTLEELVEENKNKSWKFRFWYFIYGFPQKLQIIKIKFMQWLKK